MARFSKKHYEAIATVLRETREQIAHTGYLTEKNKGQQLAAIYQIELNLSSMFADDSPEFDQYRFAQEIRPYMEEDE